MKVAVASLGTVPDALVGTRFGTCSQFLVFDLDTMSYVVVSVSPHQEPSEHVSLEAIRAVAKQDVSAVITGQIKDTCRRTLEELGIDVVAGVQGMTIAEAVERFKATRLAAPESRQGPITRVAVVADGEGLEARLPSQFGTCTSFTIVDPRTMRWETVRVAHDEHAHKVNVEGVRVVVRSGAAIVITSRIDPSCCMALQALAVAAYLAPGGITVRDAIERYERGELEEVGPSF
jgi:predicted Fe-Mo cluster-binding NifX family protein